MAEVGCYSGESTRIFLSRVARVIAVDPWTDYVENDTTRGPFPMTDMREVERLFDGLVAEYPGRITKQKGASRAIAATIPDASLDLVYIDANHDYEDVVADLQAWQPKVKPGGLIAGHDYDPQRFGVIRAVRDVVGEPDAVFPDLTWAKRVQPGPKAERSPHHTGKRILIGIPCLMEGGYRPFDICLHQLVAARTDVSVFFAMGGVLPGARNRIVREAIRQDVEYVWMLDADQPFAPTDLDKLLAHNVDAVVPLSSHRGSPFLPLLFDEFDADDVARQHYLKAHEHGLIKVAAAGLAGLLIKTSALKAMGTDGWFEFTHPAWNADDYAEDFPFYRKLAAAGFQLCCDVDVRFGHAVTSTVYIVKQDGQWMTILADAEPFVGFPQPVDPELKSRILLADKMPQRRRA
jgi:hypothetical protein